MAQMRPDSLASAVLKQLRQPHMISELQGLVKARPEQLHSAVYNLVKRQQAVRIRGRNGQRGVFVAKGYEAGAQQAYEAREHFDATALLHAWRS